MSRAKLDAHAGHHRAGVHRESRLKLSCPGLTRASIEKNFIEEDGLPGHKRVYARLRRTMPGNDGGWARVDGRWYYTAAIAAISSRKLGLASPRRMHSVLAGGCPAK